MRIAIFGGSGFVGKYLAAELVRRGHQLVIATRDREKVKSDFILLPDTEVFTYDPNSIASMPRIVEGADVVINLVGVLNEVGHGLFDRIHVEFVRLLVSACVQHQVPHFIHFSAIGAVNNASSAYLRSKSKGEQLVKGESTLRYSIVRPSVIFGEGDTFVTRFSRLAQLFPILPLPGSYGLIQPIAVSDVVKCIIKIIEDDDKESKTLHIGGPDIMSINDVVETTVKALGLRRVILPLGEFPSKCFARVVDMLPFVYVFTRDNFLSLQQPATIPKGNNDAEKMLGELTHFESEVSLMFSEKLEHHRSTVSR